jgi:hypothetical protein
MNKTEQQVWIEDAEKEIKRLQDAIRKVFSDCSLEHACWCQIDHAGFNCNCGYNEVSGVFHTLEPFIYKPSPKPNPRYVAPVFRSCENCENSLVAQYEQGYECEAGVSNECRTRTGKDTHDDHWR